MKKLLQALIIPALALLYTPAFAANLLEVYNDAVRSDPVSIAAHLNVLTSQEVQQQAEAKLFPQASINGALSENELRTKDYDTLRYSGESIKLNISQVLFDMQAWRDNAKYKYLVDKTSNDYIQAQSDLIVKVVERYFNVLEAEDALNLSRKNTQTIAKNVEQLKALYKRQLVAITGVYEAEARHDLALSTEIEAEAALSVAYERLYEVIGKRVSDLSPLKEQLKFLPPDDAIEQWVKLALESNPALAAAKSNIAAAKQEVAVKKAGWAPRLSLGFIQSHQDTGYDNAPRPVTDTSTLALSFSQPLYQGGGISAQKRESIHRLEIARQAEIETRRRIEQQVREYYHNLKSDVLKIKATQRRIESEQKRAESMRAGFKYGTATVNDILNAETDFLKAQLDHQKAKYNYIKNQVKLKSAAGTITESDILELNNWVN